MIRVLCVDDDPLSLDLAKAFLEESGDIQSDTATSAEEALRMMTARRYDVIISDYCMPSMDGLELLKKVGGSTLTSRSSCSPAGGVRRW